MIVSDRHGFVFIHNPKCGGTVFRSAIDQAHDYEVVFWGIHKSSFFGIELDYAHLRLWEVDALYPDIVERMARGRSLVFVRNPRRRFISAVHQHVRFYRNDVVLDGLASHLKLAFFHDFIAHEFTIERVLSDYRYIHFSPQTWFCMLGGRRMVKHILPLFPGSNPMDIAQSILELRVPSERWRNDDVEPDDALLADPVIADFVNTHYVADYAFFRSIGHLAPLAKA